MATVFKTLLNSDIASTKTLLNEAIPITGTIVSGTYSDNNIRFGDSYLFESVYDYPYQSSSANHIFDITYGYSSELSSSSNTQNAQKMNIYSQMAQILAGYDQTNSVRRFDADGDYTSASGTMNACVFINYSRLLTKDEIKKGQFTLQMSASTIGDYGAATNYRVGSPAGDFASLYTASSAPYGEPVGLIYYQAGIAVLTASAALSSNALAYTGSYSITGAADDIRSEWIDNDFQNTTELNSTIYFCRANNGEFNYSANPTYLSSSEVIVKDNNPNANPFTYITTVGLYSADNELLAVAKLSEPIKKDPTTELTFRVRLDY
jgi:hypothetical protein